MNQASKRTVKNVKLQSGLVKPVQVVVSKHGNLYTVHVEMTGSILMTAKDLDFEKAQKKYREFQIVFLGMSFSELNPGDLV